MSTNNLYIEEEFYPDKVKIMEEWGEVLILGLSQRKSRNSTHKMEYE